MHLVLSIRPCKHNCIKVKYTEHKTQCTRRLWMLRWTHHIVANLWSQKIKWERSSRRRRYDFFYMLACCISSFLVFCPSVRYEKSMKVFNTTNIVPTNIIDYFQCVKFSCLWVFISSLLLQILFMTPIISYPTRVGWQFNCVFLGKGEFTYSSHTRNSI